MKKSNTIKVILISAIFAVVAFATVTILPNGNIDANCTQTEEQLTECERSGSLPDIELMRNAAARAKDIFSIVSQPLIR